MIAGIILAAGASSRMGRPKALLEYRGETFVERLTRTFSAVCNPVVVVLGQHADLIRPGIEGRAQIVVNPDPDRGQLSSLQTALAVLPPGCEGFLFAPVDCPAAEPETIRRIVEAFESRGGGTLLVVPEYSKRHGHPVCAAAQIARELLELSPTGQARDVIHNHVGQTVYVDVDDPGILTDIDNPEAYRRLTESVR